MAAVECIVCGASVTIDDGLIEGELIDCRDCGVELEVAQLTPVPVLREAPTEAEDWGQ